MLDDKRLHEFIGGHPNIFKGALNVLRSRGRWAAQAAEPCYIALARSAPRRRQPAPSSRES